MSIPKIIHYCWFGGNPLPAKVVKCIESWKKFCPDYEIKQWSEDNYDFEKNQYIKMAYKEKKWAFVADYARLDVLYEHGGIYLDTDVELLGSIDFLLENKVFMAIEKYSSLVNTGLGFGCEPGNEHVKKMRDIYNDLSFYKPDGKLNVKPCTEYTTEYLKNYGYVEQDIQQMVDGINIFPSEYFCPIDYNTGKMFKTNNTIGIHWYDASWFSENDRKIHDAEAKIKSKLPNVLAKPICWIYRKGFRLVEYTKDGIMIEKIKSKMK